VRGGLWLIAISAIMFVVFGSFLGGLFGGFGWIARWWPIALILVGILSLVDHFSKPRRIAS
jgi:hypothetical protein